MGVEAIVRSSAPVAPSTRTVPPAASTADSIDAARMEPNPDREPLERPASTAAAGAIGVVGAGSYQRSGVAGVGPSRDRVHSGRASGVGENWSAAGDGEDAATASGVTGLAGLACGLAGMSCRWVGSSVMGMGGPSWMGTAGERAVVGRLSSSGWALRVHLRGAGR